MPAILIAGTHSGCGKTTITLGILAALRKKGLTVQPFKAGPDFIDSGLHRLAVDRPSRNLDLWMCGQEYVTGCFKRYASCADIAVIEGVMGMHDGEFSSAELARLLHAPVLLVVDAYGMAESAGAIVQGFVEFGVSGPQSEIRNGSTHAHHHEQQSNDPKSEIKFAGVVFNRVASESHYKRLKESVRDVPVLGYLPRELDFEIPHRHLGLTVAEENPLAGGNIQKLADTVLSHIDIDAVIRQAGDTGRKEYHCEGHGSIRNGSTHAHHREQQSNDPQSVFRIAVAYDKAFNFYYEDNLDLLKDAGADIIRFSPLMDPAIPDAADAVYIGGGYPELHAEALSRNTSMVGSIRAWAEAGRPIYAECGGLMYLSHGIRDFDNNFFAMAGVFPFETRMMRKPRLAYREIVLTKDCILGNRGERCRGHEFHYSEIARNEQETEDRGETRIYSVKGKAGEDVRTEGFLWKNTLASYIHVHFGSNRRITERFAALVKGERNA